MCIYKGNKQINKTKSRIYIVPETLNFDQFSRKVDNIGNLKKLHRPQVPPVSLWNNECWSQVQTISHHLSYDRDRDALVPQVDRFNNTGNNVTAAKCTQFKWMLY